MEVPSPVGDVKVVSPISNFVLNTLTLKYSQTSLIRTPKGQNQVSTLQRCPHYRGRECMIFGISGTKQTVIIERCPYYRGVCKERLDFKVPFV